LLFIKEIVFVFLYRFLPEFFDRITKGFGRKESGHLSFRAKKTEVEKKLNLCYHFDKYRSF